MATWSQSHFLQALGWATLNSFWQMAILWCLFLGINYFFKLSSNRKYQSSVLAIVIGFAWFLGSFFLYYQNRSSTYSLFENTITHNNNLLNIFLLSASLTYLFLLFFPAMRLFKNWQYVQQIKIEGHLKANLDQRLFVQKIAGYLGITKKVKLVISSLVSSPVTIGYVKPVILLPIAALNNLTAPQVEAILLHELSHIRRYDYLVNLMVSVIYTLLYFNPFVKAFMQTIEAEREACCDETVLQFGYDKVGYASALLHLEKASHQHQTLALAAAGKQNLLTRIEKIVGMEKKKSFKLIQIVPLFLALFCVLLFNSVLIIKDASNGTTVAYGNDAVFMPGQLDNGNGAIKKSNPAFQLINTNSGNDQAASAGNQFKIDIFNFSADPFAPAPELLQPTQAFVPVSYDEVESPLTAEENAQVKSTVDATRKVASTLQWKEIEASIGEVMSRKEKALAKKEYLQEVEKISWNNIEQNLKDNYDKLDWTAINENVTKAMAHVQLDSLQVVYKLALTEMEKAEKLSKTKAKCATTPLPDASVTELHAAKVTLRKNLDSIKNVKVKKIVHL